MLYRLSYPGTNGGIYLSSRLPDPLGPGDAFDQGRPLAAELGAALALAGLAGGEDELRQVGYTLQPA